MYPSLYYLFKDLFGVDWVFLDIFKTFGVLMLLGFLSGGLVITWGFKRLEAAGKLEGVLEKRTIGAGPAITDLIFNGLLGFLVGYKVPLAYEKFHDVFRQHPEDIIFSSEGYLVPGIILGLAAVAFQYWVIKREALETPKVIEELVMPHQRVFELLMVAAFFGILGSKVLASITEWDDFIRDPLGSLLSFQGLTFYGGFISASIALIVFARKKNIKLLHFMDTAALGIAIGYGVGRLGCHFAGDGDWGDPNPDPERFSFLPDWLWAYDYPNNVAKMGVPIPGCEGPYCMVLPEAVFPTPVWEFLMFAAITGILMFLFKRIRIPGILFCIYLVFNGLERFAIESIRITDEFSVMGFQLTQAQYIAIGLMILGIVLGLFLKQRDKNTPIIEAG